MLFEVRQNKIEGGAAGAGALTAVAHTNLNNRLGYQNS